MSRTLTIQLSEELELKLEAQAEKLNLSLETLILQSLEQSVTQPMSDQESALEVLPQPLPSLLQLQPEVQKPEVQTDVRTTDDPLLKLLGSIHLEGIHDLGENHDYYIGQALYRELHPDD